MDPRALSLGLRCWPQWRDWLICYQTGALVDPYNQTYTPGMIQAGALMLRAHELSTRTIFADMGQPAPLVEPADLLMPRLSRRDTAQVQQSLWGQQREVSQPLPTSPSRRPQALR